MVNIKQLIKDRGITQIELSRLLNEYPSVISLMVNGKRSLSEAHIAKLIECYGEDVVAQYEINSVEEIDSEETKINLKALIGDYSLTQTDIANILGEPQSVVSALANGKRKPMKRHIDALVAHFGQETIDAYTIPDRPILGIPTEAEVTILSPDTVEEMRQEIKEEIEAEEIKKTIVLPSSIIRDPEIDIRAEVKAGNLDEYAKPTQDILPLHQGKVYTYCDDMEPEIRAGEPVLVRLLPSGIPIVPGEMYFVDMPSGGKIRYVEKEEEGKLYLKARNTAYGDIVIERSEVQSLWSVVLILRTPRSMNMREATAQEMLVNKDRHLDRLLDQMEKGGERERMLIEQILGKK